jgi:DNA-binding transcriptional MerR regulator
MAELSRRSAVPVATIKYYLREGLLPPGEATAATRAAYDESHVRRLRLIRALIDIGEMPVAAVKHILNRVDDESVSLHDMFGAVQYALGPAVPDADEASRREVDELITALGWRITARAPARELLAASISALREAGAPAGHSLRAYAEALRMLADAEVASVAPAAAQSRVAAAEAAVAGMVLRERVLIALRRLAQEDASGRRYGASDP